MSIFYSLSKKRPIHTNASDYCLGGKASGPLETAFHSTPEFRTKALIRELRYRDKDGN